MKSLRFFLSSLTGLLLTLALFLPQARAITAPPALKELCDNSTLIVLGHYIGGMVAKPKGCEFWVTFQVKPDKFYKKPSGMEKVEFLQFQKRYFVDTKQCANVPGPNAMPEEMEADLKKPKHDKKVFFFKTSTHGSFQALTDIFWGIVNWGTGEGKWHKEFKETPACHPLN